MIKSRGSEIIVLFISGTIAILIAAITFPEEGNIKELGLIYMVVLWNIFYRFMSNVTNKEVKE